MKKIAIISGILLSIVICIYINYFHLGSVIDIDRIHSSNIIVEDDYIELNVNTMDSALTYSRNVIRIEGQSLYIKIYYALPSKFRKIENTLKINLDTTEIDEVYIEDGTNTVEIWRRN